MTIAAAAPGVLMTAPRPARRGVWRAPETVGPATDAPALAEVVLGRRPTDAERGELARFWRVDWTRRRLRLDDAADRALAATAVAFGTPVAHGQGAGYALTMHPDATVVAALRAALHRPAGWRPAALTTRDRLAPLIDAAALHPGIDEVLAGLDERLADGPVSLTLPAGDRVPGHLVTRVDGVATVEVVVPGARCEATAFVATALARTGLDLLATTRPHRTDPLTGRPGPTLTKAAEVQAAFGGMRPGAVVLAHRSDRRARRRQATLASSGP